MSGNLPGGYPVKITVRIEFSDGGVHEHEVRGGASRERMETIDSGHWLAAPSAKGPTQDQ